MLGHRIQSPEHVEGCLHLGHVPGVIGGHIPTNRHPCSRVEQRRHSPGHRTTHVLKINVDAVRAGRLQVFIEIAGLIINTGIKAQLFDNITALLRATGDTNHTATLGFGRLANHSTDRSGSR